MGERMGHRMRGYVEISVHDGLPERFFNLCALQGMEVWNIRMGKNGDYRCRVELKDFWGVRPLARKARVRLKVKKRGGIPFFLSENRKRVFYACGLGGFFLVLFLMSLFLWEIRFTGNVRYTDDALLYWLEQKEIQTGVLRGNVHCEELEARIREEFPEIIWVSARILGTRLLIQVKENEVLSVVPQEDTRPCDIVAERDGRVVSMVVRQGTAKVKTGDEVAAGQVLVSGYVPVNGDDGQEITAHLVAADGDVQAETNRRYEANLPLSRSVRVPTGKIRKGWHVRAFSWSFVILMPDMGKGQWDYIKQERQLAIFPDFYLPVYGGNIVGREMVSYEKSYSTAELKELAGKLNRQFVEKLEEKGVQILENNDRIEKSVSGCRIYGRLVTREAIGTRQLMTAEENKETKAFNERN